MQRVGHVDAFPELIERKEHRITRVRCDADELEHVTSAGVTDASIGETNDESVSRHHVRFAGGSIDEWAATADHRPSRCTQTRV